MAAAYPRSSITAGLERATAVPKPAQARVKKVELKKPLDAASGMVKARAIQCQRVCGLIGLPSASISASSPSQPNSTRKAASW